MLRIYPYKKGSKSAKALAKALNTKQLKLENSKFKPKVGDIIINWGASDMPAQFQPVTILNHPEDIKRMSNKKTFFEHMSQEDGIRIVPFTSDRQVALQWIRDEKVVVCRTILNGHSGRGIVIASTEDEVVDAPLYTQYVKKKEEFRVHIFNNKVFDVQRKAKRNDAEEVNWQVRNHDNGFIYQRNDINVPDDVLHQAKECFEASGLAFAAIDIIWNEHQKHAYVLEVNTAPGLEGTTLDNYAAAFKDYLHGGGVDAIDEGYEDENIIDDDWDLDEDEF